MGQYGGVRCSVCGISDIDVLTIDHVGGGASHRNKLSGKRTGASGYKFYSWLKKEGYPPGYRVLCFNCNVKDHTLRVRENAIHRRVI